MTCGTARYDRVVDDRGQWGGTIGTALRLVAGVVLGAFLGSATWLILIQEEVERGWGEHDFLRVAGALLGAGIDDATKAGYLLSVLAGLGIAALTAAFERRLPASTFTAGLVPGAVILLLWGVVFGPIAASRVQTPPSGLFGHDGGWISVPLGTVAAAAAGMVTVRVVRTCAEADWWRPGRHGGVSAESVSFELAEERREERVEGPG